MAKKLASLTLVASVFVRKITASVVVKPATKPGKCQVVTHAGIWYGRNLPGGRWLGEVALAGRWTEAQVLAEFAKNPKRWGKDTVPAVSGRIEISLAGGIVATLDSQDRADAVAIAHYTPEQALAYFKAEPGHFQRGPQFDLAVQCRLVAA